MEKSFKPGNNALFAWHFPLFSKVFNQGHVIGAVFILIGLVTAVAGFTVFGFGLANIGVGILGLWTDRALVSSWPLSPVAWFSSTCIAMGGVGPILTVMSGESPIPALAEVQLGVLVGHASFFCVYSFVRPAWKSLPPFLHLSEALLRPLVVAGVLALIFSTLEAIVSAITGGSDRGAFGATAQGEVFGVWSYFGAFNRAGIVGFLLAPLVFARGNLISKLIVVMSVAVVMGLGFLSGSRSSAFTPMLLLTIGYVAFVRRPWFRLEPVLLISLPLIVFLFGFLDVFRNTSTFRQTDMANPMQRLQAVAEARGKAQDSSESEMFVLGERLIGTIDNLIYISTPASTPHAGAANAGALVWLYVPYFVYPNRPIMLDGKAIAEQYLGRVLIGTSIGSSLTGDWYRRYGWPGVVFGMAVTGLAVGLFIRLLTFSVTHRYLFGIALWLVVATFFTKDANMTVLSGLWWLLYDFPKNAVLLWVFMLSAGYLHHFFMGRAPIPETSEVSTANARQLRPSRGASL
jgi:hypothetical protein